MLEICIFCGDTLDKLGKCSCGTCLAVKTQCRCGHNLYVELSTMVPRCTNAECEIEQIYAYAHKAI